MRVSKLPFLLSLIGAASALALPSQEAGRPMTATEEGAWTMKALQRICDPVTHYPHVDNATVKGHHKGVPGAQGAKGGGGPHNDVLCYWLFGVVTPAGETTCKLKTRAERSDDIIRRVCHPIALHGELHRGSYESPAGEVRDYFVVSVIDREKDIGIWSTYWDEHIGTRTDAAPDRTYLPVKLF